MITKRQREILETMAKHRHDDYEGSIIYERGMAFLGDDRIATRTVFNLLRLCAISLNDGDCVGGVEHYTINGTGLYLIGQGPKPEGHDKLYQPRR